MDLAYRLLIYFVAMIGPTVLFLGLMRGLEWLRDDALLLRIAESETADPEVSEAAARAVGRAPVLADGGDPSDGDRAETDASGPESVVCSSCGESNRTGSTYCRACVGELS